MKRIAILACAALVSLPAHALDLGQLLSDDNVNAAKSLLSNLGKANKEISPEEAQALGAGAMSTLLGAAPLVDDEALQRYVNQVGSWVAAQAETQPPGVVWRFGIIDTPNINSFAAPGGYILITKGLWNRLQSESELAAVLGHEVTHVLKRHHLRAIEAGRWQNIRSDTLSVLTNSVLAAKDRSSDQQQLIKSAGNLAKGTSEWYTRGLDKHDEYEADLGGMVLAARAGYNPYALVSVLQLLGNVNPADSTVALMFSTHPSPANRLDNIELNVGDKLEPYSDGTESTPRFQKYKRAENVSQR